MFMLRSLRRSQQQLRFALIPRDIRYASAAAALETKGKKTSPTDVGTSTGIPLCDGPPIPQPEAGQRQISPRVQELVDQISSLSLLEVADLNYALKKRLNIPDTPMMMSPPGMMLGMATAAAASESAPQEEEKQNAPTKTSFAVKLNKFDDTKKVALIKAVRDTIQGMNLVQAKKLIESAPVEIKADLGMKEAEELKSKLEENGATCEVV